jgi:hypothetical protein
MEFSLNFWVKLGDESKPLSSAILGPVKAVIAHENEILLQKKITLTPLVIETQNNYNTILDIWPWKHM